MALTKINVIKTVKQEVTMEVELPYYYEYVNYYGDREVTVYGKVDQHKTTSVECTQYPGGTDYSLIVEDRPARLTGGSYFTEEYRSTEDEYKQAKTSMLAALTELD